MAAGKGLGCVPQFFPGHYQGDEYELEQPGLELACKWKADAVGRGLAYYVTMPVPVVFI